ncbi:hypothetical protein CLIM01_06224 [Colletotrichum limetticola]|uniref:Uncharacterized protein n=1 Tax=Colletotrichum limetticola TaxID=1209924 RepID=A0ABQ9PY27_9PEZI|nr:hypothetical protein CLIM01_06224 [Colletotrichum limetticola]
MKHQGHDRSGNGFGPELDVYGLISWQFFID